MSRNCDIAYVIQAEDGSVVKVGVSGNPNKRVYGIRQTMPFPMRLVALISDGKSSERQMKELLSPWKLKGEWFEPRPELNDFLAAKHRENHLLCSMTVDDAFSDQYIKPAVLDYQAGRVPNFNDCGDLVYRFLREGSKVIIGREDDLHVACKREFPRELISGFVPLAQGEPTPSLKIPDRAPASQPEVAS